MAIGRQSESAVFFLLPGGGMSKVFLPKRKPEAAPFFLKLGGTLLGTALAIDGGRDNAPGISGSFAAGVEPGELDVGQGEPIARDAHRGGGAGFYAKEEGLVGEEAVGAPPEGLKALR